MCLACPKHSHTSENTDKSAEDSAKKEEAGESAVLPDSLPSVSSSARSASPSLRGAQEQDGSLSMVLKSKEIQSQVAEIVQRAVKQLTAQEVLPALNAVEGHARGALLHAAHRVCSEEEEDDADLAAVLMSLVRLVSAIKAVRADISSVDIAWVQLKDAIRNLAEAERLQHETPEKAAEALIEFLQAEMWMTIKTELLQNSTKVLKDLIQEKEVNDAISGLKAGEDIVSKLVQALEFA